MMAYCDTEKWAQLGLDLVKIARTLKSNIKYKCFELSKVLNIKKTKQKSSHFIQPETWREQQEMPNNLKRFYLLVYSHFILIICLKCWSLIKTND